MLVLLMVIVQLGLTVFALVRSFRERFATGVGGGLLRACLTATGLWLGLRLSFSGATELTAATAGGWFVMWIVGPAVSFGVLYAAHRRMRAVPAAEEERAGRPFAPWLAVSIVDGMLLVIAVAATLFGLSEGI